MKAKIILFVSFIFALMLAPSMTFAHCDTMDGPVITAAKKAIETKNPNYFLVWVQEKDEVKILEEFKKVLEEREKNPNNTESIDTTFFGSLVKIHREGEGASYTGIKPAGDFGSPLIPMVDSAIDSGSSEKLEALFPEALRAQIAERFQEVMRKKNYPLENVQAGREYVESYIVFFHWALNLYNTSLNGENSHAAEGEISHNEEITPAEGVLDVHGNEEEDNSIVSKETEHSERTERDIYENISLVLVGVLFGAVSTLLCLRIFRRNTVK
ncbi:MAG: hypothetical protein ACD_78C00464G0006 [uncultured bacterium (gcode 4)]|uniref:Uncharacterized protein n=1 Tax=uncultured bacterium (gcode 4) TaxID=1234023 RepID=K1YVJ0_9BACT|nr:MAG: hypothetical protein ACD_78C00464G0006 [uncultured bacterium (gcode 4)]HBB27021.1 hypothetical protein [Candidatus Gracilibacteria bacterium]